MSTRITIAVVVLIGCIAFTSARKCYYGRDSFTNAGPCRSNVEWCGKQINPDGSEYRACDDPMTCPTIGERCTNLNDGSILCCCDSDLCNGANMSATQSVVLSAVALISWLSYVLYMRS